MVRLLNALTTLARSAASVLAVVLGLALTWLGYEHYYAPDPVLEQKKEEIASLRSELENRSADITRLEAERGKLLKELETTRLEKERLDLAVRLLKVDRRVAQIDEVRQWREANSDKLMTEFRFAELSPEGQPLREPREFVIEGDLVFVDYRLVKFHDELVEQGDPLHAATIGLFHRIFGEFQKPSDGFVLDEAGDRPAIYASGRAMGPFEQGIWANFWTYALDPAQAAEAGIRSAHGEAPSIRLLPGKRYRLILRSSGGLSFEVEDVPGPTG